MTANASQDRWNATLRESVLEQISAFLARDGTKLDWLKPAVAEHRFLPLYIGWTAVLGIDPDGVLVRWEIETDRPTHSVLINPYWQRVALCEGARVIPELRGLLPGRPMEAVRCDVCSGTGKMPGIPDHFVCGCGGVGWVIPGESRDDSPG